MAFEDLLVRMVSKLDDRGFRNLDRLERKATRDTSVLSNHLRGLFVGVIGTLGVRAVIDAQVRMDTLTRSFEALAGGAEAGAAEIAFVRQEAERLGQSFETVTGAYRNLFAAGTGAGFDRATVRNVFSGVLEAATVLGSSQQAVGGALLALEQIISKGRVSMEELRRQLGNALPGAFQIAARAMGVTTAEFNKMVEEGITAEEFIPRFANQVRSEFRDKLPAAVGTLRAEFSRLRNAIFFTQVALLEGEGGAGIADAVRQLTRIISSEEFLGSLSNIGKLTAVILENIRLIFAIGVVVGIRRLVMAFAAWYLQTLKVSGALGVLNLGLNQIIAGNVIRGLTTIGNIMRVLAIRALTTAGSFAAWALALGLIIDAIETLQGKETLITTGIEAGQRFLPRSELSPGFVAPGGAGLFGSEGLFSGNGITQAQPAGNVTNNVIINANNANAAQVGEIVKRQMKRSANNIRDNVK